MTTRQTPDAVREEVAQLQEALKQAEGHESQSVMVKCADLRAILAALDSRAGDAFDMPEYAPDDISHLEGLASYLDGVARDKGRAGLPASKSLFEEIAKRLREYDVIRNRSRAGDAGEGWKLVPDEPTEAMLHYLSSSADPRMTYAALLAATPAPAVDAVPAGEVGS